MHKRDEAPLGRGGSLLVILICGVLAPIFSAAWIQGSPLVFALVVMAVIGATIAAMWTGRATRHLNLVSALLLGEVIITVCVLSVQLALNWWQVLIAAFVGGAIGTGLSVAASKLEATTGQSMLNNR